MWTVTRQKVLNKREVRVVLTDMQRRAKRTLHARQNLIIFRLATCCGLRVSEIGGLVLEDVRVENGRPSIRIRPAIAKGGKGRIVPLIFDRGTLEDLRAWKETRLAQANETGKSDRFVCSLKPRSFGTPLSRYNLRRRYKGCCRVLGAQRQAEITIHHGRHTFISHALCGGYGLVEVKEAAGHSSLGTTSVYAHIVTEDEEIGDLFK